LNLNFKIMSLNFCCIGAGNLATHLSKALHNRGFRILQVYSRTEQPAKKLAELPLLELHPEALALVAGQDVEPAAGSDGTDGRWRIARKVAPDRVISTVDPDARHTRKSPENRRDGYRTPVAAEPETGPHPDEAPSVEDTDDASLPAVHGAPMGWRFSRRRKGLGQQGGEAIDTYGMAKPGDRWLFCLAGGKDSYTLLAILHELKWRGLLPVDLSPATSIKANPAFRRPCFPSS